MLRGQLVGGMPTADPESSVETYEGRKQRADDLGDQRFLVAEQSGRLVALLEEIERVRLALEAGARRVAQRAATAAGGPPAERVSGTAQKPS